MAAAPLAASTLLVSTIECETVESDEEFYSDSDDEFSDSDFHDVVEQVPIGSRLEQSMLQLDFALLSSPRPLTFCLGQTHHPFVHLHFLVLQDVFRKTVAARTLSFCEFACAFQIFLVL